MISTGTDIKPLEILLFMRAVKSANFFEQMKGRGTRVIDDEEFSQVTPNVPGGKTHFVLVDAVGVYKSAKTDDPPLEREPAIPLKKVLNDVALGKWRRKPELLSTLLSRLSRLNRRLQKPGMERAAETLRQLSGGKDLHSIILDLDRAIDPDERLKEAQAVTGQEEPSAVALREAMLRLASRAVEPFDKPELRDALITVQARDEQGVKANVLFFDKRQASFNAQTERLWIYDLRTNMNFTLRTNPLREEHLAEFIACYNATSRHQRQESERFRSFTYEELLKRDKLSLDLFWLRDESLEGTDKLPPPAEIAASIVEDLQNALEQFMAIAEDLGGKRNGDSGTLFL